MMPYRILYNAVLKLSNALLIVDVATFNFSLAWVRLLIEDGPYSRVAFVLD